MQIHLLLIKISATSKPIGADYGSAKTIERTTLSVRAGHRHKSNAVVQNSVSNVRLCKQQQTKKIYIHFILQHFFRFFSSQAIENREYIWKLQNIFPNNLSSSTWYVMLASCFLHYRFGMLRELYARDKHNRPERLYGTIQSYSPPGPLV